MILTFFAASLLMVDFTTTITTITTFMRFALDNDALRRVVAVAIRRVRRVRRGYKKEQRSCEKRLGITIHCSQLSAMRQTKF